MDLILRDPADAVIIATGELLQELLFVESILNNSYSNCLSRNGRAMWWDHLGRSWCKKRKHPTIIADLSDLIGPFEGMWTIIHRLRLVTSMGAATIPARWQSGGL